MMMKQKIIKQIENITSSLIKVGLSVEQNFPSSQNGSIYINGKQDLSIALKNISYKEIYTVLEKDKNYNIKMIDGALIQFMYLFEEDKLIKYRLAFFPSPSLEEFQNNSEIYEIDEIYADVIAKNILPVPIRFDYDPKSSIKIEHPSSHLTIGQYKNCRIPVSLPITPNIFIDFILRNFYNTASNEYQKDLAFDKIILFENCIENEEKDLLHISFANAR
jgi:hypothetical protein